MDPITQFFPDQEAVNLYEVLSIKEDAKLDDIKKAYRRLALAYHPDKHVTATTLAKGEASIKFQQIGFAYAVLSDEKRRKRYDSTGKTDEGFELAAGEDGWEAYFEEMFERVTRGKLDEMKKEYQGSLEESNDLRAAYISTNGSIDEIMTYIPHATFQDEARFVVVISELISKGDLPAFPTWQESIKDEKSKLVRKKQGEKEAEEAEKLAKELGVWDEFYGSGKTGERKGKGKGKGKEKQEGGGEGEEDHSTLQALILKKRANRDGFLDSLALKYVTQGSSSGSRARGRKRARDEDAEPPKKKSKRGALPSPEITDEEFAKLQKNLFDKDSNSDMPKPTKSKGRKKGK